MCDYGVVKRENYGRVFRKFEIKKKRETQI